LDFGFQILDFGFWILNLECAVVPRADPWRTGSVIDSNNEKLNGFLGDVKELFCNLSGPLRVAMRLEADMIPRMDKD
jgi:hypothetical protein